MKVGVFGGGAAGFFAAIHAKENFPNSEVSIFEKTNKVLAKVKISGGGRCNVTNGTHSIKELRSGYPRGEKLLKKLFKQWNNRHTIDWFESKGVALKTEDDNRVFPVSNNSQDIIDCLYRECDRLEIDIQLKNPLTKLSPKEDGLEVVFNNEKTVNFDKVIIATGGSPKLSGFDWLSAIGQEIVPPVPSLFTFNLPNNNITTLQGLTTENVLVNIEGSKHKSGGPLLITHWGMSGPAVLKLSSIAARDLHASNYDFNIRVNWTGLKNEDLVITQLQKIIAEHPNKLLQNIKPFGLANRLWQHFLSKSDFKADKVWAELGKKGIYQIVRLLCQDSYQVQGKTTFKEEFVTCGGVSLDGIDASNMNSHLSKHLYFAGEVLNIDGITGGYNFQAAWTTAYIAAQLG